MSRRGECLRCDWVGTTSSGRCPSCGEPVYHLGEPAGARPDPSETRGRGAAGAPAQGPTSPSLRREPLRVSGPVPGRSPPRFRGAAAVDPQPGVPAEPARRSRPLLGLSLVALVLAAAVGGWLRANTREPEPTARPLAPLSGTLVYAGAHGADRTRLWVWDLDAGRVTEGPIVDRPMELVNARAATLGWVGLTTQRADGSLEASVLRFLGPEDRPVPLARGDLIAWDARGESVVAATRGRPRGCVRRIAIVHVTLLPLERERQFDRRLCGDLISIARDGARTYFSLERRGEVASSFAGSGRAVHPILPGHAIVAVSSVGDLIVVPASELPTARIPPAGADEGAVARPLLRAALFFVGLQPDRPIPYALGADRFAIERVLAWSSNSLVALVAGRLGDLRGLFELDGGPGDGLRPPTYLGPVEGATWATFADDGTGVVEMGGALFAIRAGRLVPMSPPVGAPGPSGPIVWLPPTG